LSAESGSVPDRLWALIQPLVHWAPEDDHFPSYCIGQETVELYLHSNIVSKA
jgi:hypothetical protein